MPEPMPSLDTVFCAAIDIASAPERAAYIAQACGDETALRAQVEKLVAAHFQAGSFLESPQPRLQGTIDEPLSSAHPDTTIGPYKLLEKIGEGGMGTVWMAQQTEPVKRVVALKLIKAGMDSKQVIARFEAERQALALMDHPNIARVLDAGTTGRRPHAPREESPHAEREVYVGRLYFVMELVKGIPITKYCDEHHLTPRQRLELFVPVCQAIQHAHQKGIIHRDLKPSNVLVALYDGKPVPKVIDFGVAKAAGQSLTDKTLVTGFGAIVGTLEYMSPEQAEINQLDIDTRSDIYSLGVLLYELLTGSTPFNKKDLEKAGMLEMLRVIREQEPSKPSTKLSTAEGLPTLAANRGTEPAKLTKLVRGELDWIVMKALEKDRSRRFETANGFALDVQRYLADEPVQACPPSAGYRLRKFARRNKAALVMASVISMALLLAVGSLGWAVRDREARETEVARQRADRQGKIAGQIELIVADVDRLMKVQKWDTALATARRAEAVLTGGEADMETAQRVRSLLKDLELIDRLDQIRMQHATLVEGKYDNAGADRDYAQAFRDYGVDVEDLAAETSIDRLKSRTALAIPVAAALDDWVFNRRGLVAETDAAGWKRLVAVARGIDPEPLRDQLRATWGRPVSEAKDQLRRVAQSIDIRAQLPATLVSLARTLLRVKDSDAAVRLLQEAQHVYPGDFWLNCELGHALWVQNDQNGATRFYTAAVSIRPNSPAALFNLGGRLADQGKVDEAIACWRKAIELDPKYVQAYRSLAGYLSRTRNLDEAVAVYRKVAELDRKDARAYHSLGTILAIQNKVDEAIASYRKAIELDPKNDYASGILVSAYFKLGEILRSQGNLDEAIVEFRLADNLEMKKGTASPQLAQFQFKLAGLLNDRAWQLLIGGDPKSRDPKRAIDLAEEAVALAPNWLNLRTLGLAHYRAGNWKAALEALEKSRHVNPIYAMDSVSMFLQSMVRGRLSEKEQARTLYDQAAQWRMVFGATDEELRRICAEAAALLGLEVPPALAEPPVVTPGPTLLKPAAGATLDNGTYYDGSRLMVWEFDWSDVPGATQYHLHLIAPNETLPTINNVTLKSSSYRFEAKGHVAYLKSQGWRWKARAMIKGIWSDWSEERTFDVAAPAVKNKAPSPKK